VVDHGPELGLAVALAGAHPHLTILTNHANAGFGAGCNRGAASALAEGASAVWFLNNDALLKGPVLGRLMELSQAHPSVALWATHQLNGDRREGTYVHQAWYRNGLALCDYPSPAGCKVLGPAESLGGASLFITRENWARMGPWPERFFLYWEDVAWSRRAHELGLPLVLTDLEVLHLSSRTIGRRSHLQVFYNARNRLLLRHQIHPTARIARFFFGLYLVQKRIFQGRWDLLPPAWNGVVAGWRNQQGRDARY
jgi:GT2 family glycosyltransferase